MSTNDPIETPVTRENDKGDQGDALQALGQFYRALNSRDLEWMQQNWANSTDAAMSNSLGGIKRGWSQIRNHI